MLEATATRTGPGLRHEVDVNRRHTLVTDEPVSLGGADIGPAPHELLPAALAACISTMISMYAETKGWDLTGLTVHVEYDHQSTPRRFDVEVLVPATLTRDQRARIERVAATCPIRRALEAGFEFDERITDVPAISVANAA